MGKGIFNGLLNNLKAAAEGLKDNRREGFDLKYKLIDALKSALAVFFFQHPSMLDFQTTMKQKWKRCNLETVMGVQEIPSNVQITTLLDGIDPDSLSSVFNKNLHTVDERGGLKDFRCLDGGVLLALDGVRYFSSEQVHCKHCLHTTKEEVTTYYHSVLAGTLVKPGNTAVLPVAPEMITNTDGTVQGTNSKKQDCERNAAKRWLTKHAEEYKWLSPTLLGDDLYSNYPFCKEVLERGYSFIFTCKEDSHPWLTETVENSYPEEASRREWNGRHHLAYTYRWLNGVEIRDNKETLMVNYFSLSIWNEEKNKQRFKFNTFEGASCHCKAVFSPLFSQKLKNVILGKTRRCRRKYKTRILQINPKKEGFYEKESIDGPCIARNHRDKRSLRADAYAGQAED